MGPPVESDYGEASAPQDAPEAISKAVASLPPEQMFELMKQMKVKRLFLGLVVKTRNSSCFSRILRSRCE